MEVVVGAAAERGLVAAGEAVTTGTGKEEEEAAAAGTGEGAVEPAAAEDVLGAGAARSRPGRAERETHASQPLLLH